MKKPVLYLMLGYPGAGKTTVSEVIAETTDAIHLNSDNLRLRAFKPPKFNGPEHTSLYAMLDYLAELILKSGKDVIYDANLNKYEYRREKYDICAKSGAEAKLIWVKTDEQTARKRAVFEANKHSAHRPFGNMKPEVFNRLIREIEPPRKNENPVVIDGSKIGRHNILQALGLVKS